MCCCSRWAATVAEARHHLGTHCKIALVHRLRCASAHAALAYPVLCGAAGLVNTPIFSNLPWYVAAVMRVMGPIVGKTPEQVGSRGRVWGVQANRVHAGMRARLRAHVCSGCLGISPCWAGLDCGPSVASAGTSGERWRRADLLPTFLLASPAPLRPGAIPFGRQGAATAVYAATAPEFAGSTELFLHDCKPMRASVSGTARPPFAPRKSPGALCHAAFYWLRDLPVLEQWHARGCWWRLPSPLSDRPAYARLCGWRLAVLHSIECE